MRIGQVEMARGQRVLVDDGGLRVLGDSAPHDTLTLAARASADRPLTEVVERAIAEHGASDLNVSLGELDRIGFRLLKPIAPPEVWGAGVTYRRQALANDADLTAAGRTDDRLYGYVYASKRPEIFFKGFDRSVVGPGAPLWLRPDAELTVPEAELVVIVGGRGEPIAYTIGNDLTAWDLEVESPLFLNQAKIWTGSGAIGPMMAPVESLKDPYDITLSCRVTRGAEVVLDVAGNTSHLHRGLDELCHYLTLANAVSPGSVLFTGTACAIDHKTPLQAGDVVEIHAGEFGTLRNQIKVHERREAKFVSRRGEHP